MAAIRKAASIEGSKLRLRNAVEADAAFIFSLRHDPARNRHMSATSPVLDDQRQWLERYATDQGQAYFIIETLADAQPLGTVRLYDAQGDSFCWGSWMLEPGAPSFAAIESVLMVYRYALDLGFTSAHFEVQDGNLPVSRFHENFGAVRVGHAGGQIQYSLSHENILQSLHRYRRYLPGGIQYRS
ncbi:MAG: GNAT family N-acetyltransferase [Ottowia sp.]|uniref:GNAT family N-acetyltransferase n=1 Tax=Ottowia sp. TaxID=1898956 RepID=UPI003C78402E